MKLKKNLKAKKEAPELPESTLTRYIRQFGLREAPVPQDHDTQKVLDLTVRREFLANHFGGNGQELFSQPAEKHVERHGIRLILCPAINLHPFAPQRPGYPGLVFDCPAQVYEGHWFGDGVFPCMAGLGPGVWLYVGHCEWKGHDWLSSEEWQELPYPVSRKPLT